jgi:hypothetical protein
MPFHAPSLERKLTRTGFHCLRLSWYMHFGLRNNKTRRQMSVSSQTGSKVLRTDQRKSMHA